jgi:hypothetical protein
MSNNKITYVSSQWIEIFYNMRKPMWISYPIQNLFSLGEEPTSKRERERERERERNNSLVLNWFHISKHVDVCVIVC